MNSLETLIEHFPGTATQPLWSWGRWGLSKNPSITLELIEKNLDKSWNWATLSGNQVITPDFIEQYPDKDWDYYNHLSSNQSITPEFIESHFYDNTYFMNPNPTNRRPTRWSFLELSRNPAMNPEFIERHPHQMWNWGKNGISSNPSITQELIERHPEKSWDYSRDGLSRNPVITPEFVKRNPEKHWDYGISGLSSNPSITPEYVLETLTTSSWCFRSNGMGLLSNPGMTLECIDTILNIRSETEEEREEVWMINHLSSSPLLTESYIESHPEYLGLWDIQELAMNLSISHEFFVEYYCHNLREEKSSFKDSILCSLSCKHPEEYLSYLETNVYPDGISREIFQNKIYNYNPMRLYYFADPIAKSTSAPYYSVISKYEFLTADFVIKHPDWKWDFGELGLSTNPMMRNCEVNKRKLLEWNMSSSGF
jgi:hypothetical protein